VLPLRIRAFSPGDLPSVRRVEDYCFGDDCWSSEEFLWYAHASPTLFLVALRGARIVGYGVALADDDRASIDSIGVRPSARRSGVGASLLRAIIRRLRRRRIRRVTLMVRRDNHSAISLYRSLGFRRTATVARYYDDGTAGWRMSLRLTREP
jgi:ribosomal-protein-alanine N-acetyltransferase